MLSVFFSDAPTTHIYTLSLHDALPIYGRTDTMNQYLKLGDLLVAAGLITNLQLSAVLTAQKTSRRRLGDMLVERGLVSERSEEHTSELQSLAYPVCRLLLEKKKVARCALRTGDRWSPVPTLASFRS